MLNPLYTYIILDFETTGLDPQKDEPIQIGIVSLDHQWKIAESFSSLIKPSNQEGELKTIVTYLTQKKQEDLIHAPDITTVIEQIKPFLQANTVLIGHNIQFDLTILRRYTTWTPLYTLDTFVLSKALIHFLPSYALEVVHKHIPNDTTFHQTAHDALYDCHMSAHLFAYCIQRLQLLRHDYTILDYILHQGSGVLPHILKRTTKPYKFTEKKLFLPVLRKPSTAKKKILRAIQQPISMSATKNIVYYVGDTTLHDLLDKFPRSNHDRLITVAHLPKVQIITNILDQLGVSTSWLHDTRIFLPERIDLFLHKEVFDDNELLFIAKYLSHHQAAHTIMDINTPTDYKIFSALTTTKPSASWNVIVCTHQQLYEQKQEMMDTKKILFFDQDRRRHTRWAHLEHPFDPYQFLQHIDHKLYEYTLLGQHAEANLLEQLLTATTLFLGVLWSELNILFTNHASTTLEIDTISTHIRMPRTRSSLVGTQALLDRLLSHDDPDHAKIRLQRNKLKKLLHETVLVRKNMYAGDQRYYSFSEPKSFNTFDEFQDELPKGDYLFFSTLQTQAPNICLNIVPSEQIMKKNVVRAPSYRTTDMIPPRLANHSWNVYFLSTRKDLSQALFKYLVDNKLHETYTLLAENITWWVGKILFLAQKSQKPLLIIGGYICYFQTSAKKISFDHLIPYFFEGKQKQLILQDLLFY